MELSGVVLLPLVKAAKVFVIVRLDRSDNLKLRDRPSSTSGVLLDTMNISVAQLEYTKYQEDKGQEMERRSRHRLLNLT